MSPFWGLVTTVVKGFRRGWNSQLVPPLELLTTAREKLVLYLGEMSAVQLRMWAAAVGVSLSGRIGPETLDRLVDAIISGNHGLSPEVAKQLLEASVRRAEEREEGA